MPTQALRPSSDAPHTQTRYRNKPRNAYSGIKTGGNTLYNSLGTIRNKPRNAYSGIKTNKNGSTVLVPMAKVTNPEMPTQALRPRDIYAPDFGYF